MAAFVRAAALKNYAEVARSFDLDPDHMLGRVGVERSMLDDLDNRLPTDAVVTLLEESAAAAGCPTFGLRMVESRELSDFGAVTLLLSHQPTLRNALRALIEFRHLLNESLALLIEDGPDVVVLREAILTEVSESPRQATEMAIGVLHQLCGALSGAQWRPREINFTHAAPPDLRVHRRLFGTRFGCRLHFESDFDGIVCARSDLDRPIPTADPVMARYSRQFVEAIPATDGGSVLLDVRKAVYILLPMGYATIERVADGLDMSVRTMQRRLGRHGATFQEVLDDVRRDLARRYLENPHMPITRICTLLGYTTPASFTRWFKANFDVTPSVWRKRLIEGT